MAEKYVKQGAFVEELLEHLEGTAKLALELAQKNEITPEIGFWAGYWHDVTRGWSSEQSRIRAQEWDLGADAGEISAGTSLLHGHISARLWQREFGAFPEWQKAIACHTLGTPNPTLYQQIIGVADFAAYNRNNPLAKQVRQIAFQDLSNAYLTVYESKVKHLTALGRKIHPRAQLIVFALQRSANAG